MDGGLLSIQIIIRLSQPSLAGVGAELGNKGDELTQSNSVPSSSRSTQLKN